MKQNEVPVIYAFIYAKIKEKNRGLVVRTCFLKEIIGRIICWSEKSHSGVPRIYIHNIIKDMENLQLLKRVNHIKYQILQHNCEKRLKKFIW